jgi:superfamily II DNA or RNA helicase
VLDGPPPTWVTGLSDAEIRVAVGAGPFARGSAYATTGAVETLSTGDRGRLLLASVAGSGGRTYQTLVSHDPHDSAHRSWSGRCSCPMRVDCKHVVAVLLTARAASRRDVAADAASAPTWEAQLADLVRPSPTTSSPTRGWTPLALQIELHTREPSRYSSGSAPLTRLRLRPVVAGKSGAWVKTGMNWRTLDHRYGTVQVDPAQREPMMALLMRYRAGQPAYLASYQDPQVHLDELGPSAWAMLAAVQHAGVPLVAAGRDAPPVRLSEQPARLILDVRRDPPDGPAELTSRLEMPDAPDVAPHRITLVGSPAHGCFVAERDRLLLVPFDAPLDEATSRLLRQREPVVIPAGDMPRFLALYSPVLRRRTTLVSGDASVKFPEPRPPRLTLRVGFEPAHRVRVAWGFAYRIGDDDVRVPITAGGDEVVTAARDPDAEAGLLASLGVLDAVAGLRVNVGSGQDVSTLVPNQVLRGVDAARFVTDVLPALQDRDDVIVTTEGTPVDYSEVTEAPEISVGSSDADASVEGSGTDWFDLQIAVTVAGQEVPFADLLTALANDDDHLILDSGTWFRLDQPELQTLRRLVDEARALNDSAGSGLRITRWQAGLWEELVELGVVAQQSERWTRSVQPLLSLQEMPTPAPPATVAATLRPYQLEGYHWLTLLWDHQLGGVLADDMGLGKTLQTLTMAARALEQGTLGGAAGPILVVAPTSVVSTWAHEAARFCPALQVVSITETERRSGRTVADLADDAHLVVTSYALLRIDDEAFRSQRWSGLVLDEAQFVKNHRAKTYQAARRIEAPFRLAITGTPLENSLMDLWAILSLAAPGLFPNPQRFTDVYRTPIESGQDPEKLAMLRRRIRPLMLRRTKEQVARDLPPKIEQTIDVTLNPAHRRLYDQHLQRERQRVLGLIDDVARNRVAIFRSLTLLRRLSLDASLVDERHAGKVRSSKIDVFMEQLDDVVAEGHRALVFSQFTGFLSLVRARLDEAGVGHVWLDGRTRNRQRRIDDFREGDAPVFLISLKAGGVGLTLTEADYVFLLDPWWNPAAEAQAVDRTHRIGQDKTVMVYRLVATDTIEEKVVALQQRKRDLFTKVVDEGALQSHALTAEDIRGLFEG